MNTSVEALVISFALGLVLGFLILPMLRRLKVGQTIRGDGPGTHLGKKGTPTMGGIIFLLAMALTLWWLIPQSSTAYTALAVTLGFGLVGFADDYLKVALRRPLGLKARAKLAGQLVVAAGLALAAVYYLDRGTVVRVPLTGLDLDLGLWYVPFVVLLAVATANAVNLSDGLDGLATGLAVLAAAAYWLVALVGDQIGLAAFAASLVGACLAFLVFNRHPARVFMGDTGSMALGGALAALAVLTRTELLLPVIGAVFVIEALSVILQVASFKLWHRRIFRMSPMHHHFELLGWPETRVVRWFWLAGLAAAALGILGLYNLG